MCSGLAPAPCAARPAGMRQWTLLTETGAARIQRDGRRDAGPQSAFYPGGAQQAPSLSLAFPLAPTEPLVHRP